MPDHETEAVLVPAAIAADGPGGKTVGEMTDMDIAGMWRSMRIVPGEAPGAGAHQETPGLGISIDVTQECQTALPLQKLTVDEVTVTVTSERPGVAAQVVIGANFNSPDGSYQDPTTPVGQGEFTATDSEVEVRFVVLPAAGWPVLGVGAEALWEDGAPGGAALTYELLVCDPLIWWTWLIRLLAGVARPFGPRTSQTPPRGSA